MKRYMAAAAVFASSVLWGLSGAVFSEEKAATPAAEKPAQEAAKAPKAALFSIGRAVVSAGVQEREPVDVKEVFPVSADKAFCYLEAKDVAEDTSVSFVWFHGDDELNRTTVSLGKGARWRTYANKTITGMQGGWRCEIRDAGGSVLKTLKFLVE